MLRAARREIRASNPTDEDGPFVSFTDLFVGVLFFFLILIAALMIMQRTSVQMARNEAAHDTSANDAKVAALAEAMSQATAQVNALSIKNKDLQDKNKELQDKLNSMPSDAALKAAGAAESARRQLEKAHAGDVARINTLQAEVGGLTAKIDERAALDKEHPPFRLALAFNVFGSKGPNDTDSHARVYYWGTTRIFRSPGDECVYNPLTDFENHGWQKHDTGDALGPSAVGLGKADKCYLTADRVYYMTKEGGYDLKRISPDLYAGTASVIAVDGTRATHYVEYRILGIYDDAFKWPHQ